MVVFLLLSGVIPALIAAGAAFVLGGSFLVIVGAYMASGSLGMAFALGAILLRPRPSAGLPPRGIPGLADRSLQPPSG